MEYDYTPTSSGYDIVFGAPNIQTSQGPPKEPETREEFLQHILWELRNQTKLLQKIHNRVSRPWWRKLCGIM